MTEETNTQPNEAVQETDSKGLLGETPTETNTTNTTNTEQPSQTASEERANWLPEKFKTPEDLAKSYTELEKKMAEMPKAPKDYNWDFTQNLDLDITNDVETKKEAEDLFRSLNMSQKQIEGVVALYKDQLGHIDEAYQKNMPARADLDQENATLKKQWGTEYDSKLEAVKKFAGKLPPHVLTMPLTDTADGLEILYNMMESGKVPNPITNTATRTEDVMGIREKIRTLRADERMKLHQGDPVGDAARQELYRLYEQLTRAGG